ncbi:hypothetical protein BKA70DRAFT_1307304 [Coprinopsis sp. MPI-PUGE-AT-0042]|nr:hypothetical protein BKA70DRAFT_1307304 [Coprinopsis sp. MPI-PUGE-AT-0042]
MDHQSLGQLHSYTRVNDPYPAHLEPTLSSYLDQLSSTISALDAEIFDLERQIRVKKEARGQTEELFKQYSRLRSPIRKMPFELLALVFGHVFGTDPFTQEQYHSFAYLRGTCKAWRNIVETTPNLCRGLEISLDNINHFDRYRHSSVAWDAVQLQTMLAPWLAIVARSPRYHLTVKNEGATLHSDNVKPILQHLILSHPRPETLKLASHLATQTLFRLDARFPDVHFLKITGCEGYEFEGDMFHLVTLFPHLSNLIADCTMLIRHPPPLFKPTKLRNLHLGDLVGEAAAFSHFLQAIPTLKELRLGSIAQSFFPEASSGPLAPGSHPSLETLILDGQDLFALLRDISFPLLRLFCLEGMKLTCPEVLQEHFIPNFLCRLQGRQVHLTVSLRGRLEPLIIAAFINHIPPRTRLHFDTEVILPGPIHWPAIDEPLSTLSIESDDVDEIFCTEKTGNLRWINRVYCRRASSQPIKLYIPSITTEIEQVETRRSELRAWGYKLEVHPAEVLNSIFCSSIPHTDIDWF